MGVQRSSRKVSLWGTCVNLGNSVLRSNTSTPQLGRLFFAWEERSVGHSGLGCTVSSCRASHRCRTTVSRRQLASRPFSQAVISRAHCSRRLMRGESSGSVSRDFNIYVEASRSSALGPTVIIPEGSLGDSAGFRTGGREGSVLGDSQGGILLAGSLREPRW